MGKNKIQWSTLNWEYPPISIDIDALKKGELTSADVPPGALSELSILRTFCRRQIHRIRTQQYAFARSVDWDKTKYPAENEKADAQVRELGSLRSAIERLQCELRA